MPRSVETLTLTVANAGTDSTVCDTRGREVAAIAVPTITSATIALQVSADGTTFYPVKDSSATPTQIGLWPATTGGFALDGSEVARCLVGWRYFKVVLGASQGAARSIVVQLSSD